MAKFSLINVTSKNPDNTFNGYWLQDCIGSIEKARKYKKDTEIVNGNKIKVIIVDQINSTVPALNYYENLIEIE